MTLLIWQDGDFRELPLAENYRMLIIDSWRHSFGKSFGLGQHAARFNAACGSMGSVLPREIWQRIEALLARPENCQRELFPRISLLEFPDGTRRIGFEIRPAPAVRETTTLVYGAGEDHRQAPVLKGPDLALFAKMKAGVEADDVIISDTDGACLETTTGALVLWKDDVLVLSDRPDKQLPSVTLYQIFMRARDLGKRIGFAPIYPDDLAAGPVWFLNALHGISPVTQIQVGDTVIEPPRHSEEAEWISWWWAQFGAHADNCEHPDLTAFISSTNKRKDAAMSEQGELQRNLDLAEEWADTFKTLGDPTRLKLLSAIHFAGRFVYTVSELAEATGVRIPTASAALRAMEANGTVISQRDGRSIRYGIHNEHVHELLHWIGTGHQH